MAVLGFCEPNCDWLRILTSRKSFSGSSSQTVVYGGDKRQPEIRLRSQATLQGATVRNLQMPQPGYPQMPSQNFLHFGQ